MDIALKVLEIVAPVFALAGIGFVAGLVIALGLDVPRVGDLASIEGGFPLFHNPFGSGTGLYGTALAPFTLETLYIIAPYAVILAAIGLIESLLTLNLVGDMTNTRGGASQECIAQGFVGIGDGRQQQTFNGDKGVARTLRRFLGCRENLGRLLGKGQAGAALDLGQFAQGVIDGRIHGVR